VTKYPKQTDRTNPGLQPFEFGSISSHEIANQKVSAPLKIFLVRCVIRANFSTQMTPDNNSHQISLLLIDWSKGDEYALEQLMPLVYPELRLMARSSPARF
jgi:hypothetical protein